LIGNSEEQIRKALAVAASPEASIRDAVEALTGLRGIDISVASAILAAIYPERYAVLDFRALDALGHARHDIEFYEKYIAFCQQLAEHGSVKPQSELPGPTPLHALERALWEWSRSHVDQGVAV
jgi:ribosomal protein L22